MTGDEHISVTLADGRLRWWSDGCEYSNVGRKSDPDDDYIPFPTSVSEPVEHPVQPAHSVFLGFPVIAPGYAGSHEAAVDVDVFHSVQGHANEFMLREMAKSLRKLSTR